MDRIRLKLSAQSPEQKSQMFQAVKGLSPVALDRWMHGGQDSDLPEGMQDKLLDWIDGLYVMTAGKPGWVRLERKPAATVGLGVAAPRFDPGPNHYHDPVERRNEVGVQTATAGNDHTSIKGAGERRQEAGLKPKPKRKRLSLFGEPKTEPLYPSRG